VGIGIGGMVIAETVEGLERYPIQVRFPREDRDSLANLSSLPILTKSGATVPWRRWRNWWWPTARP